jgi:hypothetical protein
MATDWLPCGSGFIEADVIRWTESVWHKPKRGRATKTGECQVTAEVIGDTDGWVQLLVRDCRPVGQETVAGALPSVGSQIRRKRQTIEKGRPERLLWSDEAARALIVARRPGEAPSL